MADIWNDNDAPVTRGASSETHYIYHNTLPRGEVDGDVLLWDDEKGEWVVGHLDPSAYQ